MKPTYQYTLVILGLLLVGLALTKPDETEVKHKAEDVVLRMVEAEMPDQSFKFKIVEGLAIRAVEKRVEVKDYLIFNLAVYHYNNTDKTLGIGIAGQFLPI